MGEVVDFDQKASQDTRRQERVFEFLDHMATLAVLAPALAAEASANVTEVGAKLVKKLVGPKPPEIPWYTPYDTVEELREKGLSDKEIGRVERFKRKSHDNLNQLTKVGG